MVKCSCQRFTKRLLSTQVHVTKLASRGLLKVSGADAAKFLQGLIANDVQHLTSSSKNQNMLYSAILNAPGRMLFDVFIHKMPQQAATSNDSESSFLIDHQRSCTTPLTTHLKRHILRSKVKLADVSEQYTLHHAWNPFSAFNLPSDLLQSLNGSLDSRTTSMGYRFLSNSSHEDPSLDLGQESIPVNEDHYKLHRMRLGVPEGIEDLPPTVALPLESNMDYMGGIDLKKGCYVGQELTARTHHTGVTRKRIVPVRVFQTTESVPPSLIPPTFLSPMPATDSPNQSLPPPQSDLRPLKSTVAKPRPSGKLNTTMRISNPQTSEEIIIGLALIRLEQMQGTEEDSGVFSIDEKWRVKGFGEMDWWQKKAEIIDSQQS